MASGRYTAVQSIVSPDDHARKRAQSATVVTAFDTPMPLFSGMRKGTARQGTSRCPRSSIAAMLATSYA